MSLEHIDDVVNLSNTKYILQASTVLGMLLSSKSSSSKHKKLKTGDVVVSITMLTGLDLDVCVGDVMVVLNYGPVMSNVGPLRKTEIKNWIAKCFNSRSMKVVEMFECEINVIHTARRKRQRRSHDSDEHGATANKTRGSENTD